MTPLAHLPFAEHQELQRLLFVRQHNTNYFVVADTTSFSVGRKQSDWLTLHD